MSRTQSCSSRADASTPSRRSNVITFLEQAFGVDFGDMDFNIEHIGSIDSIAKLLGDRPA